jgi:hypothetical protein
MISQFPPVPQRCHSTLAWIAKTIENDPEGEIDIDDIIAVTVENEWLSEQELLDFHRYIAEELAETATRSADEETASIFGRTLCSGLRMYSPYSKLWELAYSTRHPALREDVNISEWDSSYIRDIEVDSVFVVNLIPLAFAYEFPIFDQLGNMGIVDLSEVEEEFLGHIAAMVAPGYREEPAYGELMRIPSSKILFEILDSPPSYSWWWKPEYIREVLESDYADKRIKDLIAKVIVDEENDEDSSELWNEWKDDSGEWDDDTTAEILRLCAS